MDTINKDFDELYEDPIGTDCPCEMGYNEHYHPECPEVQMRWEQRSCETCRIFHLSKHTVYGIVSYGQREPYEWEMVRSILYILIYFKDDTEKKYGDIIISSHNFLLNWRIKQAKKLLIKRREILESIQ